MISFEHLFLAILGGLLFLVYTPFYHSELPDLIRYICSYGVTIFIMFTLLIYFGNSNLTLSIILAISISLIRSLINKHDLKYHLIDKINKDFYQIENNQIETFKVKDTFCVDLKPYYKTMNKIGGSLKKCLKKLFGNSIGGLCENFDNYDNMNMNDDSNSSSEESKSEESKSEESKSEESKSEESKSEESKSEESKSESESEESKSEESKSESDESKSETDEEKSSTLTELLDENGESTDNYNNSNMN